MKVKFEPQNVELEIQQGQSVMDLAHKNDLPVKSVCNGLPSCAECRIKIKEGEHNVLPPSAKELSLIGSGYFIDGRRLSCQLMCYGDITVDLSEQIVKEEESGHRRPQGTLRKEAAEESLAVTGNLIDQEHELIEEADREVGEVKEGAGISGGDFYQDLYKQKKDKGEGQSRGGRSRRGRSSRGERSGGGERSDEKREGRSDSKRRPRRGGRYRPGEGKVERTESGSGEQKASSGDKGGKKPERSSEGGSPKRSRNRNRNRNRNRSRNKTSDS